MHSRGLHLEKLHASQRRGAPLFFSIRASQSKRLILTKQGKEWVWVDLLPNHEYDKFNQRAQHTPWAEWLSKQSLIEVTGEQLRSGELDHEAANQAEETKRELPEEEVRKTVELEKVADPLLYHNQFMLLDEMQQKVLSLTLPLIITGSWIRQDQCCFTVIKRIFKEGDRARSCCRYCE